MENMASYQEELTLQMCIRDSIITDTPILEDMMTPTAQIAVDPADWRNTSFCEYYGENCTIASVSYTHLFVFDGDFVVRAIEQNVQNLGRQVAHGRIQAEAVQLGQRSEIAAGRCV